MCTICKGIEVIHSLCSSRLPCGERLSRIKGGESTVKITGLVVFEKRIGDTLAIAKKTPVNLQVETSLVPIALTPGLGPVKPQVVHPQLALPNLIRCQTAFNSLIYGAYFGNDERGTDSLWNELQDDEPWELSLLTVAGSGQTRILSFK